MKIKTWMLAVLLLGSAYVAYRWLTQPIPDALAQGQSLLRQDTTAVYTLSISGIGDKKLTFTRENQKWLVSDGANSGWVQGLVIQSLLRGLTTFRSLDMRPHSPSSQNRIEVDLKDKHGQQIDRFELIQEHPDSFWFSFPGTPEVYRVATELAQPFFRPSSAFLPTFFVTWEWADSITYQVDSSSLTFRKPDTSWLIPESVRQDSIDITTWLGRLATLVPTASPQPMQNEFQSNQIQHDIQIWDGGQLTRLRGVKTPAGLGAWNSQRPEEWLSRVDSGWYEQLFPLWLDSLVQTQQ